MPTASDIRGQADGTSAHLPVLPKYPPQPYGRDRYQQAQPYGQQPWPPPEPQGRPARTSWPRRHKVLTVLGGLTALIIIAGVTGGGKRQAGQRRFHRRHHHAHTKPDAGAPRDEKEDKAKEDSGYRAGNLSGVSSSCSRRSAGASTGNCSRRRAVIFSGRYSRGLPPADQRG